MTWVLVLLTLAPIDAAKVAATVEGVDEQALLQVCRRESRCKRIGVHEVDSHLDGYGGQVRLGHLDPTCQHWAPRTWTTWGAWGLSAASNWRYLPRCYQPHHLAIPIVSALAAARKIKAECGKAEQSRWCPRRRRRATPPLRGPRR